MQATMKHDRIDILRIVLPALFAIGLFVLSSFYLYLPYFEKCLLDEKKTMLEELVQSAWNMVHYIHQEVSMGIYSIEEGKTIAIGHLREMKYGRDKKDYFWINDFSPAMVMHPYRPDLVGKDMSDFVDPNGTRIFVEFLKTAQRDGEGFVSYLWQSRDEKKHIVPKLSFIKAFKPWGWIIGTGIYIEDVQQEVGALSRKLIIASLGILVLVSIVAWYQIHRAVKVLKMRRQAEAQLLEYKDQLEFKVAQRTAELSSANTELKKIIDEMHSLKGTIPICMHCKKIRNDHGAWEQLEKYITEHSEADFSHGMCEKCMDKFYPDTDDE